MKLKNKKTGEIGWLYCDHISVPKKMTVFAEDKDLSANHWDYASLSDLNAEWEDYEEPKEAWFINELGNVEKAPSDWLCDEKASRESIGNRFKTKEEAEKAVEKLKAWKRLKDDGFKFKTWGWENKEDNEYMIWFELNDKEGDCSDLDLLFGGEE